MICNQLKYLACIRDCKNISQSARILNISQPSLSRMLKEKEMELGHQLFIRDRKGQIDGLTAFGKLFFSYVDQLIHINERYHQDKLQFERSSTSIILGIPLRLSSRLVDLISQLRILNPDIDLKIITDHISCLQEKAESGFLDYVVEKSAVKLPDRTVIHSFQTVVNIPPAIQEKLKNHITIDDHGNRHIHFSDLLQEKFYISSRSRLMGDIAEKAFETYGRPEHITYWDTSELALLMSEKEDAVAFCAWSALRSDHCVFFDEDCSIYFYLSKVNPYCPELIQP